MLENRKILVGLLGVIIGIIMGLYCKISIALFYFILISIRLIFYKKKKTEIKIFCAMKNARKSSFPHIYPLCQVYRLLTMTFLEYKKHKFKLISITRYSRYLKIIFTENVIRIIIIFSIFSNTIVLYQENRFENLYKNLENQNCTLTGIVENIESSKNRVKLKIIDEEYKNSYLYVYLSNCTIKNQTNENLAVGLNEDVLEEDILEYGDKITISGTFFEPNTATNYKGFDYSKYLKTLKIYGTIKGDTMKIVSKNNGNIILNYTNKIKKVLEKRIESSILSDDEKSLIKGILLGNKEDITEEIQMNFSKSNISYILVVSGMHISYIIIFSNFIFSKIVGKHLSKIFSSIFILIYMCIVGFTPSILRAGIGGIIAILAKFFYRKNDIWTDLSISLFIILILNPYLITNVGVLLSFAGTIGIIVISKIFSKLIKNFLERKSREFIRRNEIIKIKGLNFLNCKPMELIRETVIVTISATLMVIPIILINYNTVSVTSIFISIFTCFLMEPIMIFGILFLIFNFKIFQILLSIFLKILIFSSELGTFLPFNQIYLTTPNLFQILIYYMSLFFLCFIIHIKLERKPNMFYKRILNLLSLLKFKINLKKQKIISILTIAILLCSFIVIIPKDLKIYFVDVGQGDCTLIITPRNKKILIDGGGNEWQDSNIGETTLLPYLLDRKILKIDYVLISHFDTDHVQGILYIMNKIKVKNVIISKQFETSENFEEFIELVNNNNINLIVVNRGDRVSIEKDLYFKILWPDSSNLVTDNPLNNNSIVCKLCFKNFSCLFTGDIEELAEKEILNLYSNTNLLKSSILKVAHHGSKTSSSQEFIEAVNPKIALIGVGKNNLYGHPNIDVIERIESMRSHDF